MMNIKVVEKNIIHYTDLIPNTSAFIKMIEDIDPLLTESSQVSKWKDWHSSTRTEVVFGKHKNAVFTSGNNTTGADIKAQLICKTIKDVVTQCAKDYEEKTGIKIGFLPDQFTIKKYHEEAYMGPHVDYEGEGRADFYPTISMVLYLNDDYEGGEVNFIEQNVSITPKAGSLIVFPSHKPYYHDPRPVTSGIKYMVPLFWFAN